MGSILVAVLTALGAFFAPVAGFVGLAVSLITVDHFMGVKAAKKRAKNLGFPAEKVITSHKLKRTVEKGLLYFLFILVSHQITVTMHVPFIAYLSTMMIVRVEFKSINENLKDATGVTVWEAVEGMLKLKDGLRKK